MLIFIEISRNFSSLMFKQLVYFINPSGIFWVSDGLIAATTTWRKLLDLEIRRTSSSIADQGVKANKMAEESAAETSNYIIATETVTYIIATERSTNITATENTTCIIAIEPQDLHNCYKSVSYKNSKLCQWIVLYTHYFNFQFSYLHTF